MGKQLLQREFDRIVEENVGDPVVLLVSEDTALARSLQDNLPEMMVTLISPRGGFDVAWSLDATRVVLVDFSTNPDAAMRVCYDVQRMRVQGHLDGVSVIALLPHDPPLSPGQGLVDEVFRAPFDAGEIARYIDETAGCPA